MSWILPTTNLSSFSQNNSTKTCLRQLSLPGWKFTRRETEALKLATVSIIYPFIHTDTHIHTYTHTYSQTCTSAVFCKGEKASLRSKSILPSWTLVQEQALEMYATITDTHIRMQVHQNKAHNIFVLCSRSRVIFFLNIYFQRFLYMVRYIGRPNATMGIRKDLSLLRPSLHNSMVKLHSTKKDKTLFCFGFCLA